MYPRARIWIPIAIGLLILASAFVISVPSADAQCGSQASSCKNCHEVQGQDPVNDSGDWHVSHAFGDFCEFCHAGNVQAVEADTAHVGMVDPLSDVQASCAACHPSDTQKKAEVYAAALGVEVGTGNSGGTSSGDTSGGGSGGDEASPGTTIDSSPPEIVMDDLVDFNQRYDETVLGVRDIHWGNVILGVMIAVVAMGGGGFVIWNERRLRAAAESVSDEETKPAEAAVATIEGVSPEVSALIPQLEALNPLGRKALAKLLENPDVASDLLFRLSRLDPDLIRQIRGMDRDTRSMLLAIAGN
jgi:cytochrome c553